MNPDMTNDRTERARRVIGRPVAAGLGWLWLLAFAPLVVLVGMTIMRGDPAKYRTTAATAAAPAPVVEAPAAEVEPAAPAPGPAVVDPAATAAPGGEYVRQLGAYELRGAAAGVEAKLIDFIDSGREPCTDAPCWFTFDRLTFATGSAELDMEKSRDQLANIHEVLKAYPGVQLKIGGYTDNTGADPANMALSQARADAVVAAVVAMGTDPARMDAEGYGSQHPVASNDTEDGRAQNRRIDVRVRQR